MGKRSNLQLYRTIIILAQLGMVASNNLLNKCDQKIAGRKIKETRPTKFLSCFFEWLECVVLGELKVPKKLQHLFKIFMDTTSMKTGQSGV